LLRRNLRPLRNRRHGMGLVQRGCGAMATVGDIGGFARS